MYFEGDVFSLQEGASLQVLQPFICETPQAPPFPPFYGPEAEESVCKPGEQARIC